MLAYKFDVLKALKEAGYNTTRLRKEKLLSEGTIQNLRDNVVVGAKSLDKLCRLLVMQPGDIIEYIED